MRQFFRLLQDNLSLACAEVIALSKPTQATRIKDLLIVDTDAKDLHKRLALTRATYEFLFACPAEELAPTMDAFDWQKHYRKSFKLDLHHAVEQNTAALASHIWENLKKPKVDLTHPVTRFELFFFDDLVVCGKRTGTIDPAPFFARRPHLRPALHPSGMQPRLARALVNLTGATKGTIVDPFCGAGGILLEAGLLGFKIVGADIESTMIEKAKKNLKAFKLKAKLSVADATKFKTKVDYVVTDLPYGLNTKGKELPKLYLAFLKRLKRNLKTRAVVVFPHFVDHHALLKKAKLKLLGEFTNYLHKTLTRKMTVVEA
ncbi:methyltransferase domain-containing protein [Candidatus Woesearchaeota archaeon]|nr:methyltransferase domain-containing protein [Candidatus Woesearchaeota archaeon]